LPDRSRPNILMIFTDQQRWDTLHSYGFQRHSPATDRLAREGVRFGRAFTTIAICSPARASMLTGTYPHNHGMVNNTHERDAILVDFPDDTRTVSRMLADSGYLCGYVGKWHVGRHKTPLDFGFTDAPIWPRPAGDYPPPTVGARSHQDYLREEGIAPPAGDPDQIVWMLNFKGWFPASSRIPGPPGATRAAYLAAEARRLLRAYAQQDRPFFIRLDFPEPHWTCAVPEPYASMYPPGEIPPWPNFGDDFAGKPATYRQRQLQWAADRLEWRQWADYVSKYLGVTAMVEDLVAGVLDLLDELGIADQTLVAYTTDHGDLAGSHGLFNKGPVMLEEIYRIPMLVRWPAAIPGGRVVDELVLNMDLMPTMLEAAGLPLPADLDARTLMPLLRGDGVEWPDHVFWEYHGEELGLYSQRAIRTGRHKYIYNANDIDELYDLEEDPAELRNRIDDPACAATLDDLRGRMLDEMRRTNDMIARWTPARIDRRLSADRPRDTIE
jgi:arylsulfatase A-like enzyme